MAFRVGSALGALALLGALSGCAGYRLGDISGKELQGVHSVYVPVVKNSSLEPDLQVVATNAIIRRFNADGTLEVNQNASADSELDVTIENVLREPVRTSNSDILVVSQYQVEIRASVTFINRRLGRTIIDHAATNGLTTYFTQSDLMEAERQALPLAADDLAKNVVRLVTEGW